eukprot:701923-Heterocapsa_arctica.AAC.1
MTKVRGSATWKGAGQIPRMGPTSNAAVWMGSSCQPRDPIHSKHVVMSAGHQLLGEEKEVARPKGARSMGPRGKITQISSIGGTGGQGRCEPKRRRP